MPESIHIAPSFLVHAARKFDLTTDQIRILVRFFRSDIPFSRIHDATGIGTDKVNGVFSMRWRENIHIAPVPVKLSPKRNRRNASYTAPSSYFKLDVTEELICAARSLLRLRLDQETVRIYLQVDSTSWKTVLRAARGG